MQIINDNGLYITFVDLSLHTYPLIEPSTIYTIYALALSQCYLYYLCSRAIILLSIYHLCIGAYQCYHSAIYTIYVLVLSLCYLYHLCSSAIYTFTYQCYHSAIYIIYLLVPSYSAIYTIYVVVLSQCYPYTIYLLVLS